MHVRKGINGCPLYLQRLEANVVSDWAVLGVILLIRMHVKEVHHLVGLDGALQEEDEKSARPAHLQVVGQQAGDGFVDEGLGDDVARKT